MDGSPPDQDVTDKNDNEKQDAAPHPPGGTMGRTSLGTVLGSPHGRNRVRGAVAAPWMIRNKMFFTNAKIGLNFSKILQLSFDYRSQKYVTDLARNLQKNYYKDTE